jgi:predicted Fe-Mo cluster-binding NifX family protein
MNLAIAIWNDRISPVFDVSRKILILNIENNSVINEVIEIFKNDNFTYKISRLIDLNIDVLICGAISNPLDEMINMHEIKTIPFTCGKIEAVINAFLKNTLGNQNLYMPGCCGFRKKMRDRKRRNKV